MALARLLTNPVRRRLGGDRFITLLFEVEEVAASWLVLAAEDMTNRGVMKDVN